MLLNYRTKDQLDTLLLQDEWSVSSKWGNRQTLFTSFAFSVEEGREDLLIRCSKPFVIDHFTYKEVEEENISLFDTRQKNSFSEFRENSFIVRFRIRFNYMTREAYLDRSSFEIYLISKKQVYKDKVRLVRVGNYPRVVYDKLKELMTLLFSDGVVRQKVILKRKELSGDQS